MGVGEGEGERSKREKIEELREDANDEKNESKNSHSNLLKPSPLIKLLPLLIPHLTMHKHALHLPRLLESIHHDLRVLLRVGGLLRVSLLGRGSGRRRRRELGSLLYDVSKEVGTETLGAVGWEDVEGEDVEFERGGSVGGGGGGGEEGGFETTGYGADGDVCVVD